MSFAIITDTSSNLPHSLLENERIRMVPLSYYIEGEEHTCMNSETFCGDEFYRSIKEGVRVTTSQVPPQRHIDCMEPCLKQGEDVLFISMSSGISGSCACANMAAQTLLEQYPHRKVEIVDTLGASLGEGLVVLQAAEYRRQGLSLPETAQLLRKMCRRMCQIFTVDDLMYLRRGGRLSNFSAIVGTMLHIKPLLKGNREGKIVAFQKIRGRKRAVAALAEKYDAWVSQPETQIVGIAHAACQEDASALAALLKKNHPPKDILMVDYEPVTGSHVGPGALALFFLGEESVREKT